MKHLSCVLAPILTFACSGSTATSAPGTATRISSWSLYSALAAIPPAAKAAAFDRIGALSISQYYDFLHARTSNATVYIDGIAFADSLRHLEDSRSLLLDMGTVFTSVRQYWTALNAHPEATTYPQLQDLVAGNPTTSELDLYYVPRAFTRSAADRTDRQYCEDAAMSMGRQVTLPATQVAPQVASLVNQLDDPSNPEGEWRAVGYSQPADQRPPSAPGSPIPQITASGFSTSATLAVTTGGGLDVDFSQYLTRCLHFVQGSCPAQQDSSGASSSSSSSGVSTAIRTAVSKFCKGG